MAKQNYVALINSYAKQAGVDPKLIMKLIQQESGFDPTAVSPKGAQGLGQVMPETGKDPGYNVKPLQNNSPEENIRFTVEYFKAMRDKFGSDPLALAAFNAGPGAVEQHGGIPPYKETQNYVSSILGSDFEPGQGLGEMPGQAGAGLGDDVPRSMGEEVPTEAEPYKPDFLDKLGQRFADTKLGQAMDYDPEGLKRGSAARDVISGGLIDFGKSLMR